MFYLARRPLSWFYRSMKTAIMFLALISFAYCDSINDPILNPPKSENPGEKQSPDYSKGANDHSTNNAPTLPLQFGL